MKPPVLFVCEQTVRIVYVNAPEFQTKIKVIGAGFIPYIHYPENPCEKEKKNTCFRAAYDTVLSLEEKFDLLIYEMFFSRDMSLQKSWESPV